ncbi:hypothetical protein HAYMO_215 [Serratia phage vB_SmaM_Haymo]|uniref:Putative adhesin n=1 Tax=Serratia phage vB_SmaM_Yaphecito TaxID=2777368 RepID=A0A7T3NC48_9CAUD|nr:putative adhesin [Serratia phage vB_SmaM_Yaphecito]UGO54197.1 hypothetical protein HAYMO_215 [Serratia phage vB_SmaM_Haymo]
MKKLTAVIALTAALFSANTLAGTWGSSWAQGTTEVINNNANGSSVNFSCSDDGDKRILFVDTADGRRYDSETDGYTIVAKIDGNEVRFVSTLSRAGEANWAYFWKKAETVKSKTITVIVPNHKPFTVSTAGLKAVAKDKSLKDCFFK